MLFRSICGAIAADGNGKPLFTAAKDGHREVTLCGAIMKGNGAKTWVKIQVPCSRLL
jgi:hypothetical protein